MNPELMLWARETAGLTLEQAASALGLPSTVRLEKIEGGDELPSRPLLLKMSKQYRRSLLTFYLSAPPKRGDRGQDFRTLPPDRATSDDALLDALVRDVKGRQNMVRSIVKEEEDGQALPFIGSRTMKDSVPGVLASIAEVLRIKVEDYRAQKTAEEAFAYLREKAESVGIFVLLIGNLGTHHSAISVESFRGFAIADAIAPFIVINDQDAKTAWAFTLLHELAHLWLGATGISGASAEIEIEKFCNDVASSFLLPRHELRELVVTDETPAAEAIEAIARFAWPRHLSRKMVAYTLLRANRIQRNTWLKLNRAINELWLGERERQKEAARRNESGPNYYIVRRHRLGKALLNLVDRTMGAGMLTPVKAAKVLGVKPRSVYPLLINRPRGGVDARGSA